MIMRSVLLTILAFGAIAAGGCAGSATDALSISPDLQGTTVVMSASWPTDVLDIKALGRSATRVVSGVVKSVDPPRMATLTEGPEAGVTVVYSDAIVQTDRSLKGQAAKKAELISVRLLGGTVDGYTFVYEDEAKLAEGDRVVVFLTDSPDPLYPRDEGFQYAALWGMHGAFRIQNDIGIRSADIPADQRSIPLTEIEASVR